MMRRLVASLLLFAVIVSALPWELAATHSAHAQPAFVEAPAPPPCHAPGPAGDPCGDDCLCPFGSAHSLTPPGDNLAVQAPRPDVRGALPGYASAPHASDFVYRIFRPPRAA